MSEQNTQQQEHPMTVVTLFNLMMVTAENCKRYISNFNGKDFWQPIKAILAKSSWTASEWKPISEKEYVDSKKISEINHFQIQTVRIPRTESPSLRKIIQVALNLGQSYGMNVFNKRKYIDDFLSEEDYNQRLDTMLEQNDINTIMVILADAYR